MSHFFYQGLPIQFSIVDNNLVLFYSLSASIQCKTRMILVVLEVCMLNIIIMSFQQLFLHCRKRSTNDMMLKFSCFIVQLVSFQHTAFYFRENPCKLSFSVARI